jgi:hypothetical protein
MAIQRTVAALSCNHCCYRKATILFLCNVFDPRVAFNNTKVLRVAVETQQWVPLGLGVDLESTYFALLSTV